MWSEKSWRAKLCWICCSGFAYFHVRQSQGGLQHVQQWLEVKRQKKETTSKTNKQTQNQQKRPNKQKIQTKNPNQNKEGFQVDFGFGSSVFFFFFFRCTRLFLPFIFKWGHIYLFLRFCQKWKKSTFSCNSMLHLWLAAWDFWAVVDAD